VLHAKPIQLAHVFTAEVFEEVASHQLVAKRDEDALFDFLTTDGQAVGAGASGARAEAGKAISPVHDVSAAARGTLGQSGKEILRTSGPVEPFWITLRGHTAHLLLARLDLIPQLVIDDAQLRD
jgi:hypothetical protein